MLVSSLEQATGLAYSLREYAASRAPRARTLAVGLPTGPPHERSRPVGFEPRCPLRAYEKEPLSRLL